MQAASLRRGAYLPVLLAPELLSELPPLDGLALDELLPDGLLPELEPEEVPLLPEDAPELSELPFVPELPVAVEALPLRICFAICQWSLMVGIRFDARVFRSLSFAFFSMRFSKA
jgi:hypothetical protein